MKSFEVFCEQLLAALGVELPAALDRDLSLYDGVGLDSFKVFELVVVTEDLAGLLVPPPATPVMLTLGDAYEYYRESCGLAAEWEAPEGAHGGAPPT